jgi:hypothetical protein
MLYKEGRKQLFGINNAILQNLESCYLMAHAYVFDSKTDLHNSQHFQGLRRAQHKAESNGSMSESPRREDPNANPITRRPGPGRGRPRKQPPVPIDQAGQDAADLGSDQDPSAAVDGPGHVDLPMSMSMDIASQEPGSLGMVPGEADIEEQQPSKRQRLDDGTDHIDDAAVLALSADANHDAVDHYGPE